MDARVKPAHDAAFVAKPAIYLAVIIRESG